MSQISQPRTGCPLCGRIHAVDGPDIPKDARPFPTHLFYEWAGDDRDPEPFWVLGAAKWQGRWYAFSFMKPDARRFWGPFRTPREVQREVEADILATHAAAEASTGF